MTRAWRGDDRVEPEDGVVVCDLDDGKALLNLEQSNYFKLNGSAGHIWDLLQGGTTFDALVDSMLDRFDVDKERLAPDVGAILDSFLENQLVRKVYVPAA